MQINTIIKHSILIILGMTMLTCSDKKPYKGESPNAYILRDKHAKTANLKIETEGKWSLYSGNKADKIDFSEPILKGKDGGTFNIPVNPNTRTYFCIETKKGRALLAESHLPMEGGHNFRDLGGINTIDGKHVKWGKFIRADELNKLTQSDLSYLADIPLLSIVDFRSKDEMNNAPDRIPASIHHIYPLSIAPGSLSVNSISDLLMSDSAKTDMQMFMIEMNRSFVKDTACSNMYREFFSLLQQEKSTPVLFHCTAGKDRTGFAAAMILFSLGVDEETILKNYLESNIYLADKYKPLIQKYPQLEPAFVVKAEYLQAAINEIKNTHGDIEKYLKTVLKVDIDKMRKLYLD